MSDTIAIAESFYERNTRKAQEFIDKQRGYLLSEVRVTDRDNHVYTLHRSDIMSIRPYEDGSSVTMYERDAQGAHKEFLLRKSVDEVKDILSGQASDTMKTLWKKRLSELRDQTHSALNKALDDTYQNDLKQADQHFVKRERDITTNCRALESAIKKISEPTPWWQRIFESDQSQQTEPENPVLRAQYQAAQELQEGCGWYREEYLKALESRYNDQKGQLEKRLAPQRAEGWLDQEVGYLEHAFHAAMRRFNLRDNLVDTFPAREGTLNPRWRDVLDNTDLQARSTIRVGAGLKWFDIDVSHRANLPKPPEPD